MPELSDPDYYAARAAQARFMAETAIDPMIAKIHRRMAERYLELVGHSGALRTPLKAVSGSET